MNLNNSVINYIEKCFGRKFLEIIFSEYDLKLFEKNKNVKRVCLIPKHISSTISKEFNKINIITSALIIGWIKRNFDFIPSTHLFNIAKEKGFDYGCSVVAKSHGVKAFLYGRDLLVLSVERFLHPVEKNMYVAVLDPEDMNVVGIGRIVINPEELDVLISKGKVLQVVVENMFDLGMLIRNENFI